MSARTEKVQALRRLHRRFTVALIVVAVMALVFTASNVTRFATRHGVHPGYAWLLDPMVAIALGAVLLYSSALLAHGVRTGFWSWALRLFAGMSTWVMNVWESLYPHGGFGVPGDLDVAGTVLHSVPPVLLILLTEAGAENQRRVAEDIAALEAEEARQAAQDAARERERERREHFASLWTAPARPEPQVTGSPLVADLPQAVPVSPDPLEVAEEARARVFAAEPPRTRAEVRAEYVPEPPPPAAPEPPAADPDSSPEGETEVVPVPPEEPAAEPVPDPAGTPGYGVPGGEDEAEYVPEEPEDELTVKARGDFADVLDKGELPSFRALRSTYGIGQKRAEVIRQQLAA